MKQQEELTKLTLNLAGLRQSLSETTTSLSTQSATLTSLQGQHKTLQDNYLRLQDEHHSLKQESRRLNQSVSRIETTPQRQVAQKPIIEFKAPEIKVAPKIEMSQPRKKVVDLIIKSVSVYSKSTDGDEWDESGPPDLRVSVSNASGGSFDTKVIQDSFSGSYNVKSLRISEGDSLTFTVWDQDILANDTIGSFTKIISADTMGQRTVNWQFGGVYSLILEFQP